MFILFAYFQNEKQQISVLCCFYFIIMYTTQNTYFSGSVRCCQQSCASQLALVIILYKVALLNSFQSLKMTDIKAFSTLLCLREKKERNKQCCKWRHFYLLILSWCLKMNQKDITKFKISILWCLYWKKNQIKMKNHALAGFTESRGRAETFKNFMTLENWHLSLSPDI